MPGRKFNADAYRYGQNTQEKDNEIFEGAYTAEFWEYDSRLGRRWNPDPVLDNSLSSYSCFNNNPVVQTDVNGDKPSEGKDEVLPGTEIPEDSPLKTPKFQMRIGNNLSTYNQQISGPNHNTIAYSSQIGIYNTNIKNLFGIGLSGNSFLSGDNDATEGNHFLQFLLRIGESNWQLGLTGYKEKTHYNSFGQGHEAPTNVLTTVGKNFQSKHGYFENGIKIGKKNYLDGGITFGVNLSAGVGGLYGKARLLGFGDLDKHYRRIGESAAFIIRFDATIAYNYVFWVAFTVTSNHIDANKYGWDSFNYTVSALKGGLGINLATTKTKRPNVE